MLRSNPKSMSIYNEPVKNLKTELLSTILLYM